MLAIKTRYTFADLLEQDPRDETIYDIWGGELVVFSSPNNPHAAVVLGLIASLIPAEDGGLGRVRTAPLAVAFDYSQRGLQSQDVTHPDVLFVREERRSIMGPRCVEAAPDLLVEVLTPTTRSDDVPGGQKWAIYERYGGLYYWIVDIDARTITQHAWLDGRYAEQEVFRVGATLTCALYPDVKIDVARIFARIIP